jgi:hypothetical protein
VVDRLGREKLMLKRCATSILLVALVAAIWTPGVGCGKPRQKRTGPLKDWIVGDWARQDDPNWWNFSPNGEMSTTGRLPIGGSYSVEEPNKVEVVITGAAAFTASSMLGVPVSGENRNLILHFIVEDDEMRPAGIKSESVFRKK